MLYVFASCLGQADCAEGEVLGPAGNAAVVAMQGAYLVGLLCAFAASTISKLGQPALLYIVPAMLAAVGGTALVQGEVQQVIAFKEAPVESPFAAADDKDN